MRPRFRTDLQAAREEQQGVVFYRIDDPDTQTSFRLYEIEYLIARKLDGGRSLEQVIGAVKEEYNFDISAPDLRKFVSQLESMGFIKSTDGAGEPEPVTQVVGKKAGTAAPPANTSPGMPNPVADPAASGGRKPPPPPPMEDPGTTQPLPGGGAFDGDDKTRSLAAPGSEDEYKRLLVTAFDHLKQSYTVHARDYFLAAKESKPGDRRVDQIVTLIDAAGEKPTAQQIQEIWALAKQLFGDVVANLAPTDEELASSGGESLRKRILWLAALFLVVLGGGGGIWFMLRALNVFESTAAVQVAALESAAVAIYYPEPATSVKPANEKWLQAQGPGKVAKVVAAGSRVGPGETLVSLGVPPPMEKRIAKMREGLAKADAAVDKAAKAYADFAGEQETTTAERDKIQQQLKSGEAPGTPEARKQRKALEQALNKANTKLSQLVKKERRLAAARKSAEKRRDGMKKNIQKLEDKLGPKLVRAPSAGVAVELQIALGAAVKKGQDVVLFRDTSAALLSFKVGSVGNRLEGGEAQVSIDGGKPIRGVIAAVKDDVIDVRLPDDGGNLADMQPGSFKLVREEVSLAYEVSAEALVNSDAGDAVLVAVQGRAARRPVEVLSRNGGKAVIRPRQNSLRDGDQVVVAFPGGDVAAIKDDAPIEVVTP